MNKIIFALLVLVATSATAANDVAHKKTDGKWMDHTTYQAASMKKKDLRDTAITHRNCKVLNAKRFIKQAKLMPNANIVGGFDCGGEYSDDHRYTVMVKDIAAAAKAAEL